MSERAAPTRLVVPLTRAAPPLEQQARAAAAAGAELIELRVDLIGDAEAARALLLQRQRAAPYILTVRAAAEGGGWTGDDAERVALIEELGLLLPGYVDVELATLERSANLRQKIGLVCARHGCEAELLERPKNVLLASHHDWRETPAELGDVFARLERSSAEIIKAVFRPRDARDALRILAELRARAARRATIALALDEAGLVTRILGPKFGAFAVFAALEEGAASAPGQPTSAELQQVYHWRAIGPATRVYGVIGWPVTHSRGPLIHNTALRGAGIDAVYVPLPVAPDEADFDAFMDYVAANRWLDFDGFSVTVPHKEHALRWLQRRGGEIEALALRCGAVNTLTRRGDAWRGANTDAPAILDVLRHAAGRGRPGYTDDALRGRTAGVIGAGGAGRAALAALGELGCPITLCNRDPERGAAVADEFGAAFLPWERRDELRACDTLIQCTKVGLWPAVDESPLPAAALRGGQMVLDTVYRPRVTRLLADAAQAGATAICGVEMFVEQAARQFALWTGRAAPIDTWRELLAAQGG